MTIDPQDLIAEWYENNNSVVVSNTLPDLIVADSVVSSTGRALLTVSAVSLNAGGQAAGNVVVEVRDPADSLRSWHN